MARRDRSPTPSAPAVAVRGPEARHVHRPREARGHDRPQVTHRGRQGHAGHRPDLPAEGGPRGHPVPGAGARPRKDRRHRVRRAPHKLARHGPVNRPAARRHKRRAHGARRRRVRPVPGVAQRVRRSRPRRPTVALVRERKGSNVGNELSPRAGLQRRPEGSQNTERRRGAELGDMIDTRGAGMNRRSALACCAGARHSHDASVTTLRRPSSETADTATGGRSRRKDGRRLVCAPRGPAIDVAGTGARP
jgi:hypothetical protein